MSEYIERNPAISRIEALTIARTGILKVTSDNSIVLNKDDSPERKCLAHEYVNLVNQIDKVIKSEAHLL